VKYPFSVSMMLQHQNIHKGTWTSPEGEDSQTGSQLHTDCIQAHLMSHLVEEVTVLGYVHFWWLERYRLSLNKQATQKMDMERFNLRKLRWKLGVQYQATILNRLATVQNSIHSPAISRSRWLNGRSIFHHSTTWCSCWPKKVLSNSVPMKQYII